MTENSALPPAGYSPDADQEPDTDFQTAFWSAKHALALASATAFARHGVHEGQQFVLRSLWAEDGLTPGQVAKRLGLATPTVTRATTRMEAAGLLRREPHPSDRRMVRLRLTGRGRGLEKVIDEGRELSFVAHDPRAATIRIAQLNAFGFGGTNSVSLVAAA